MRLGSKKDVIRTLRKLIHVGKARSSGSLASKTRLTTEILQAYRFHQFETDRDEMKRLRCKADDMLFLWKAIDHQKELWKLDAGIEKKLTPAEIANRSAHRVGLHIPEDIQHETTTAAR